MDQKPIAIYKIFLRRRTGFSNLLAVLCLCFSGVCAAQAKPLSLDFAYYPWHHVLRARLQVSSRTLLNNMISAPIMIQNQKTGQIVAQAYFPPFKEKQSIVRINLPKLPEGTYQVKAGLHKNTGDSLTVTGQFVRHLFPWEHNQLGMGSDLIPPFTPLRVDGKNVHAVLRTYQMNNQGLWDQIISDGKPVLAAPIHFEIKVGGKLQTIQPIQPLKFTTQQPDQVVAHAVWSAGPIHASIKAKYDVDGMMKVWMRLTQHGEQPVQKLDLVIPIRQDIGKLMHVVSSDHIRTNYSGAVASGDGVVWQSKQADHHGWPSQFVPYIWVGNAIQGISWFADNTRGWLLDSKVSTQTIQRRNGRVILTVHFVTKPGPLKWQRTIVFAMQATPTKPMPKSWRKWVVYPGAPKGHPHLFKVAVIGSARAWGAYQTPVSIYPRDKDYQIFKLFHLARQTGKSYPDQLKAWLSGYKNVSDTMMKIYTSSIRNGLREMSSQPDVAIPYTDAQGCSFDTAFDTFQDAWLASEYSPRQWPWMIRPKQWTRKTEQQGIWYGCQPVPSYQDYHLWYINKMLQSGAFDGVYFDNVFPVSSDDPITGGAWRDHQGKLHPSYDLFDMRQYLKRAAILTYHHSGGWYNMIHMTNALIAPFESWAGMNLDLEWRLGLTDYQTRFSRDFLRTESLGRKTGCVPFALNGVSWRSIHAAEKQGIQVTPELIRHATRTQIAVLVVHELKPYPAAPLIPLGKHIRSLLYDFGYGQPDCHVFDYWQKPFPATLKGTDAEMLLLNRNGKALVFVASFGKTADCTVALDAKRLHLKPGGVFTNLETGSPLKKTGPYTVQFNLPKHDFRVIEYNQPKK